MCIRDWAALSLGPSICGGGIAPGLTTISGDQTDADFERQSRINLLEKPSAPDEIAKAVRFILSSKVYNGQILVLDGGQALMGLPRDVAFLDE